MSTSQFCRAKLVPFDAGGSKLQEASAIALDFNPDTLTLKVSGGEQRDRSRRGRQQVQNVGASKATLSFECIFDSTRPRDASGGPAGASGGVRIVLRAEGALALPSWRPHTRVRLCGIEAPAPAQRDVLRHGQDVAVHHPAAACSSACSGCGCE